MTLVLDRRTMRASARSFRGLGDAVPQCMGQQNVTGVGTTDYACGFLRGWQRIFTRAGYAISIDGRSQGGHVTPVGPAPTVQEWADFDAQASAMGVGGLTAQLQKNATPSNSVLVQLSRGLSTTGQGIAAGQLDKALKGASATLVAAAAPANAIIPGAGTVLEDALIGLTAPELLSATFAPEGALASVPLVGRVAADVGQSYVAGIPTTTVVGSTVGTQAQAVVIGTSDQGLADKLMAAGLEAFNELSFAVSVVTIVGGGAALEAVSLAMTALKGAYTIGNALRAADALKKAAAAAQAKALSDEAALDAQIASLEQQIAQVKAETAALLARNPSTPAGTGSSGATLLGAALLAGVAIEVLS